MLGNMTHFWGPYAAQAQHSGERHGQVMTWRVSMPWQSDVFAEVNARCGSAFI